MFMVTRSMLVLTAAGAAICLALPAEAARYGHYSQPHVYADSGSKGYGSGPYWQGGPTDHLPIWRNGYYQGNDPDQFIRLQLMRDPTNGPKSR
jgi:hypothetical protein